MMRSGPSLLGALAMALPMPLPLLAQGDTMPVSVRICGDPAARAVIPMKDEQDEPMSSCSKVCHAGGCRRRT